MFSFSKKITKLNDSPTPQKPDNSANPSEIRQSSPSHMLTAPSYQKCKTKMKELLVITFPASLNGFDVSTISALNDIEMIWFRENRKQNR